MKKQAFNTSFNEKHIANYDKNAIIVYSYTMRKPIFWGFFFVITCSALYSEIHFHLPYEIKLDISEFSIYEYTSYYFLFSDKRVHTAVYPLLEYSNRNHAESNVNEHFLKGGMFLDLIHNIYGDSWFRNWSFDAVSKISLFFTFNKDAGLQIFNSNMLGLDVYVHDDSVFHHKYFHLRSIIEKGVLFSKTTDPYSYYELDLNMAYTLGTMFSVQFSSVFQYFWELDFKHKAYLPSYSARSSVASELNSINLMLSKELAYYYEFRNVLHHIFYFGLYADTYTSESMGLPDSKLCLEYGFFLRYKGRIFYTKGEYSRYTGNISLELGVAVQEVQHRMHAEDLRPFIKLKSDLFALFYFPALRWINL